MNFVRNCMVLTDRLPRIDPDRFHFAGARTRARYHANGRAKGETGRETARGQSVHLLHGGLALVLVERRRLASIEGNLVVLLPLLRFRM